MVGIEPLHQDKSEIKCREQQQPYRISPEQERREKSKHHEDEKESSAGGGNIDSGYHSFNGSSNCCTCCSSKHEMEQKVENPVNFCLLQDRRKLFETPNGYVREGQSPILPSQKAELLYADVKDRGYNSLPDASSMKVMSNGSLIPSSDGYSSYKGQQTTNTFRTHGDPTTTTASPSRSCNGTKLEALAQELAEKIEFCLKLGYNVEQIRQTLQSLGHKASKNDILTKLFTLPKSNTAEMSESITMCNTVTALNEGKPGEFIGRGVSNMELLPRGPSTVEDENNESEDGSVTDDNLRPIVIDGSNVAMSHGNREYFSCKGINLAVQYFLDRGHRDITVFVPKYRKEQTRPDAPIKDQEILTKLHQDKILVWTPSRKVGGRRITCYDDRFILRLAQDTDGVIVSNDNFRDLQTEKPEWKEVIEKRLLMYSFVNDRFMPPDDPLGRNGPSLDNFLRKRLSSEEKRKPECPYGKKCTYGKKCKYFHAECSASQRSVSDQLKDGTKKRMQPSSAAKSLATEVMNEFPTLNESSSTLSLGAQKTQTVEKPSETVQEESFARRIAPEVRTSSPSEMGACGMTLGVSHQSPTHQQQQIHAPFFPMSLSSEFQQMSMRQYHLPQTHGGRYYAYRQILNDGSLAAIPHTVGNEGQSSNPSSVSMSQMQAQIGNLPPQLHSAVGRNVASSTSPHQHHLQQQMHIQHHSSPPAISVYDQGPFMGHRQPLNQPNHHPMFQNMTYPSLGQQFQNYPMQAPYYKSNGSNPPQQMMYQFPRMMQQHPSMYMGQDGTLLPVTTQSMPPMANRAYHQSYLYPQPELSSRMMAPGSLTTAPHPNMDPIFESPNRQVFSSPNPGNPNHMLHRQSLPNQHGSPVKMSPNHHPQATQPMFKDPSDPRFHLYKNLCGLFSRSTVEKVMLLHPHESDPKRLAKYCLEIDS